MAQEYRVIQTSDEQEYYDGKFENKFVRDCADNRELYERLNDGTQTEKSLDGTVLSYDGAFYRPNFNTITGIVRLDLSGQFNSVIYVDQATKERFDIALVNVMDETIELQPVTITVQTYEGIPNNVSPGDVVTLCLQNVFFVPPKVGSIISNANTLLHKVARTMYGLSDEERKKASEMNVKSIELMRLDESAWNTLIKSSILIYDLIFNTKATNYIQQSFLATQQRTASEIAAVLIRKYLDS